MDKLTCHLARTFIRDKKMFNKKLVINNEGILVHILTHCLDWQEFQATFQQGVDLHLVSDREYVDGDVVCVPTSNTVGIYKKDPEGTTHDVWVGNICYPYFTKEYFKRVEASTSDEYKDKGVLPIKVSEINKLVESINSLKWLQGEGMERVEVDILCYEQNAVYNAAIADPHVWPVAVDGEGSIQIMDIREPIKLQLLELGKNDDDLLETIREDLSFKNNIHFHTSPADVKDKALHNIAVMRQLEQDEKVYGQVHYWVDDKGYKHRIDPTMVRIYQESPLGKLAQAVHGALCECWRKVRTGPLNVKCPIHD